MQSQTQRHDMSIMLSEFQGGSVLWEAVQVHTKEIYGEFTVDIVELIVVFAVGFHEMLFLNLIQVAEIVGTIRIHTLVDNKVLPVLLWNKCGVRI